MWSLMRLMLAFINFLMLLVTGLVGGSMRLIRGYMEAFGLTEDELYTVCSQNPARVVGMDLGS